MLNNQDFGKRLQKLMDYYALSASAFADLMGVGRSSISHILSGRNKPSLDFIMKIIDTYPEVEFYWLVYGKGTFPLQEKKEKEISNTPIITSTSSTPLATSKEQDLFSESSVRSSAPAEENKKTEIPPTALKTDIQRVLIFYTDGTFEDYQPKKSL